jgi:ribonucleoside-diphosphate reductase alpha chain
MAGASGQKLDETTTRVAARPERPRYYLRTLAATSAEKSTGEGGELNACPRPTEPSPPAPAAARPGAEGDGSGTPKFCSIDNPTCEACQ